MGAAFSFVTTGWFWAKEFVSFKIHLSHPLDTLVGASSLYWGVEEVVGQT